MLSAAERISTLAEHIVGMGAGEEGERSPINVVASVATGLDTMRGLLPSLTVEAKLDGADALVISTSAEMERLVTHLCAYAAETLGNQGRLTVLSTVVAGELGRGLRLSFRGPTAHRSRQQVGRSLEFPLAMARAIVEGCGGWIDARRDPGEGPLIEVTLPIHDQGGGNVIDLKGVTKWQKSRV